MHWGDFAASLVGAATLVLAYLGFRSSAKQYADQEATKRRLIVLDRVDKMYDDSRIRNALTMLDYVVRPVVVSDDDALLLGSKTIQVSQSEIVLALATVNFNTNDAKILYIRDCMDALCSELAVFANFVNSGMIERDDLIPYLGYHSYLVFGRSHMQETLKEAFKKFATVFYSQNRILEMLMLLSERMRIDPDQGALTRDRANSSPADTPLKR